MPEIVVEYGYKFKLPFSKCRVELTEHSSLPSDQTLSIVGQRAHIEQFFTDLAKLCTEAAEKAARA